MSYVDGFVTPVPTAKRDEYRQHAADVAVLFRQAGATAVVECWGDDVPPGKLTVARAKQVTVEGWQRPRKQPKA